MCQLYGPGRLYKFMWIWFKHEIVPFLLHPCPQHTNEPLRSITIESYVNQYSTVWQTFPISSSAVSGWIPQQLHRVRLRIESVTKPLTVNMQTITNFYYWNAMRRMRFLKLSIAVHPSNPWMDNQGMPYVENVFKKQFDQISSPASQHVSQPLISE